MLIAVLQEYFYPKTIKLLLWFWAVRAIPNAFYYAPDFRFVAGIRAPRTARNASEKSEPFGQEAFDFATRRYMQRDVEFDVDSIDRSGGFIGALYVNKTENVAITLVKEGLASVNPFSADNLPWARQLYDAEVLTFMISCLPNLLYQLSE